MKLNKFIRKLHRYLGLIIGIQLFFWTVGGLFFVWSNMDQIHSDPYKKSISAFSDSLNLKSPTEILKESENVQFDSIKDIKLIQILSEPYYQYKLYKIKNESVLEEVVLYHAGTGVFQPELNKEQCIAIAKHAFLPSPKIKSATFLSEELKNNNHHEYRRKPLPVWAVEFEHKQNVTVYVSPVYGEVMTFRNKSWRVFDFLWMMHTMDYKGRDNFGNYLIRIIASFSILTILSGFVWYVRTSSVFRKKKRDDL